MGGMHTLSQHIAQIREDYSLATLDEHLAGDDPLALFEKWFREAEISEITDVNAMSLATVDASLQPHVRTVLLKGLEGGGFVFYTNYESTKGQDISFCNKVSLLFFWKELQRQVRIEGVAERVTADLSDAYFRSRPFGSRIGAIASPQSREIAARDMLEHRIQELLKQYGEDDAVPRPAHWGGYIVYPRRMEFWQGRSSRLHDRIVFESDGPQAWKKYRIAP